MLYRVFCKLLDFLLLSVFVVYFILFDDSVRLLSSQYMLYILIFCNLAT